MKYDEEQIKNLLRADLSGESKIKESLKLKLLNRNAGASAKRRFAFGAAAFAACAAVAVIFVLKTDGNVKEEYVYNYYPTAPMIIYADRYGAAGPSGLTEKLSEVNL